MTDEMIMFDVEPSDIIVRDAAKREIEVRLLPWNTMIETIAGPEEFAPGSTVGTPDDAVLLMGLEHEAHIGIGQTGEPKLTRHAVGRSTKVWEADDGPHVAFRVGRTASGDDLLALAEDKIVRGVSVEFQEVPGGTTTVKRGGRRVKVHNRVKLTGASMTTRPAYGDMAAILAVRSEEREEPNVAEEVQTSPAEPVDLAPLTRSIDTAFAVLGDRIAAIEENTRRDIVIPRPDGKPDIDKGRWFKTVLGALTGEVIPAEQMRVMADLITSDNLGVVPEAFLSELIGIIDASRPFLGTTRRLNTPASGMTLNVPTLVTRPTAGIQVNEKDDIESTETSIVASGFDAVTIAGGGDISIQLLKRSDPSYLDLYLQLLAEAVSQNAEAEAIAALLASGVTPGTGTLDPESLLIGEAWANAQTVGLRPDTLWMSSDAMVLFIDAKADGTNMPLYSNIGSNITVSAGAGGTISGLRPVHVPALDATATDVIIGPSRGFAWAEDGAFTLQVDVPSKAGRDVALVVIDWYAPLYPDAFTTWAV
jgi:hypothetical protein